jgi:predicted ATPase
MVQQLILAIYSKIKHIAKLIDNVMLKYQMTQDNNSINSHVETYLDYYFSLPHAPGFAVLLKGKWGSGKTWFINKYCEKFKDNKDNKQKCLYISLYGMTAFSEIEDAFFQQLHPVLSLKGMAITGKILIWFLTSKRSPTVWVKQSHSPQALARL